MKQLHQLTLAISTCALSLALLIYAVMTQVPSTVPQAGSVTRASIALDPDNATVGALMIAMAVAFSLASSMFRRLTPNQRHELMAGVYADRGKEARRRTPRQET